MPLSPSSSSHTTTLLDSHASGRLVRSFVSALPDLVTLVRDWINNSTSTPCPCLVFGPARRALALSSAQIAHGKAQSCATSTLVRHSSSVPSLDQVWPSIDPARLPCTGPPPV
jgi:hypothetical protein